MYDGNGSIAQDFSERYFHLSLTSRARIYAHLDVGGILGMDKSLGHDQSFPNGIEKRPDDRLGAFEVRSYGAVDRVAVAI